MNLLLPGEPLLTDRVSNPVNHAAFFVLMLLTIDQGIPATKRKINGFRDWIGHRKYFAARLQADRHKPFWLE
jgi:hypothetical protein